MSCEACDDLRYYCSECKELMREEERREHERGEKMSWSEYMEEEKKHSNSYRRNNSGHAWSR